MNTLIGEYTAPKGKIAIIAAQFNDAIVDHLIRGAVGVLKSHGVASDDIDLIRVPGAYEIPYAAQKVGKTGRYDGVVALGAVIRGATPHFEYVASNSTSGLMQASLKTDTPMTNGILTTDTIEQAIERAGTKAGNKGSEAANALLELISVAMKIHG